MVGEEAVLPSKAAGRDEDGQSQPALRVKCEPGGGGAEARGEPYPAVLYEGRSSQYGPAPQAGPGAGSALYCLPQAALVSRLAAPCSGDQQGPLGRGLLASGQYRSLYSAVRRRTVKRLLFKKRFICPYCGKCFERAGHLERHKRIHTGERPYRCELCGKRFNQKCSLKEHSKIHRRCEWRTHGLCSSAGVVQPHEGTKKTPFKIRSAPGFFPY